MSTGDFLRHAQRSINRSTPSPTITYLWLPPMASPTRVYAAVGDDYPETVYEPERPETVEHISSTRHSHRSSELSDLSTLRLTYTASGLYELIWPDSAMSADTVGPMMPLLLVREARVQPNAFICPSGGRVEPWGCQSPTWSSRQASSAAWADLAYESVTSGLGSNCHLPGLSGYHRREYTH